MGGERGGSSHGSKRYYITIKYIVLSRSVISNSLWPHGLQPTRLLCPWGFSRHEYWIGLPCPPPGDIFPTQGSNQGLLHCKWILYHEPPGKPIKYISILLCKELHSKWLGDYVLSGSEELLTPNADIVSLTTCISAIWLIVVLSVDSSLKATQL